MIFAIIYLCEPPARGNQFRIASTPTPSTRRLLDSAVHRLPNLGLARGDEALLPPHEDRRAPREGGRRPSQLRREMRVHALSGGDGVT